MPALRAAGAEDTGRVRQTKVPAFPGQRQNKGQVASALKERRGQEGGPGKLSRKAILDQGTEGKKLTPVRPSANVCCVGRGSQRSQRSFKGKQSPLFGPQDKHAVCCDPEQQEGKAATCLLPETCP